MTHKQWTKTNEDMLHAAFGWTLGCPECASTSDFLD